MEPEHVEEWRQGYKLTFTAQNDDKNISQVISFWQIELFEIK